MERFVTKSREDAVIYEARWLHLGSCDRKRRQAIWYLWSLYQKNWKLSQRLGCDPHQLLPVLSYCCQWWKTMSILSSLPSNLATTTGDMTLKTTSPWLSMYSSNPKDPGKHIAEFHTHQRNPQTWHAVLSWMWSSILQRLTFLKILSQTTITLWFTDGTPRTSFGGGRLGTTTTCLNACLGRLHQVSGWNLQVDGFPLWYDGDHVRLLSKKRTKLRPQSKSYRLMKVGEPMLVMKIRLQPADELDEENQILSLSFRRHP